MGNVLSFQRNDVGDELKVFVVTMQPKTRQGYKPLEVEFIRDTARQALSDAIRSVGLEKQEDFSVLEMMEKTGKGTYRVAYFDHSRSYSADYDISLPIRKNIPLTEEQLLKVNAAPVKAVEPVTEKLPDKVVIIPDEDDYKDSQWYEVTKD